MKIYPVAYKVFHGEYLREELQELNMGGCDGIIVHSLIFPKDGSRSETIVSLGPNNEPLPAIELWKSWVHLAYHLSQCEDLDQNRRDGCKFIFETVREVIVKQMVKDESGTT